MHIQLNECEPLVDALFYLFDKRRMNPLLREMHVNGCLATPTKHLFTPTAPFTYSLTTAAYAVALLVQSAIWKFYIDRCVRLALESRQQSPATSVTQHMENNKQRSLRRQQKEISLAKFDI